MDGAGAEVRPPECRQQLMWFESATRATGGKSKLSYQLAQMQASGEEGGTMLKKWSDMKHQNHGVRLFLIILLLRLSQIFQVEWWAQYCLARVMLLMILIRS